MIAGEDLMDNVPDEVEKEVDENTVVSYRRHIGMMYIAHFLSIILLMFVSPPTDFETINGLRIVRFLLLYVLAGSGINLIIHAASDRGRVRAVVLFVCLIAFCFAPSSLRSNTIAYIALGLGYVLFVTYVYFSARNRLVPSSYLAFIKRVRSRS